MELCLLTGVEKGLVNPARLRLSEIHDQHYSFLLLFYVSSVFASLVFHCLLYFII